MNTIREIMKGEVVALSEDASVSDAARAMRDADVGAVAITGPEDGRLVGIVTDRDIAVRGVANGGDLKSIRVSEICSKELLTLAPEEDVDRAVELMRTQAIRRAPVVDAARRVLGMVSLGDLAIARDRQSVLGTISAAPPNR